jgi:pyruvate/2-oxoglutarate dehydrogenase complex dihydrolipoamide dehydrogenase (E3) component
VLPARAYFTGPHEIALDFHDGRGQRRITADKVVVATGTKTMRDPNISFDG